MKTYDMIPDMIFDYIIVGAGSAGCVLANRLTEDSSIKVLLIEAGGSDNWWNWKIHMPAALAYPLSNDAVNWAYKSEEDPYMNNRRMYCPRGRVLGGSSSINGMAYVRGHAFDYNRWAQIDGCRGWSYADCLPYFKRAESLDIGGDTYRGSDGPLKVTAGKMNNPLHKAWVMAGKEAGYPITEDPNGYQQEGFGRMDMTVDSGRRASAAKAYLGQASTRKGLKIEKNTIVNRIILKDGKAIGVECTKRGSKIFVYAGKEVILSAGAINSPQLLMLSGIGPVNQLADLDIPIVQNLPGVGENLQDHLEIYLQMECLQPISLYGVQNPISKLMIGLQWILTGSGLGGTNHFESGGFIRSHAGVAHPNIQYHFLPIAMNYDGSTAQKCHGFQVHVGPMRPTSRGRVWLDSNDPASAPKILFNYMSTEIDRLEMREAIRLTREVLMQPALSSLSGEELLPGIEVQTDEEIDSFVREYGESAYHPSCTCAMGKGKLSVVDSSGRVHGVKGLRVVDASILPSIVSGNLNAPTIMLAEKIADDIREKEPLPPIHAKIWENPAWESLQR
jgi:choline dehydrogenase